MNALSDLSSKNRFAHSETSDSASRSSVVNRSHHQMKATILLKTNIDDLLRKNGACRKDLARWCYKSESWISKIFRESSREIPLKHYNRRDA